MVMNCPCFLPHLSSAFHHLMLFLTHRCHSYTATQSSTRIQNLGLNEFCSTLENIQWQLCTGRLGWTPFFVGSEHLAAQLQYLTCTLQFRAPFCFSSYLGHMIPQYHRDLVPVSSNMRESGLHHLSILCSQLAVVCLQWHFCSFWTASTKCFDFNSGESWCSQFWPLKNSMHLLFFSELFFYNVCPGIALHVL